MIIIVLYEGPGSTWIKTRQKQNDDDQPGHIKLFKDHHGDNDDDEDSDDDGDDDTNVRSNGNINNEQ